VVSHRSMFRHRVRAGRRDSLPRSYSALANLPLK
jgi:hypothetical protein